MEVYYNKTGMTYGRAKQSEKTKKIPIGQTFLWEKQEFSIPAVYVCQSGVVLDLCAKINSEDMISFLKKWNREIRTALSRQEEYEQLEAENPGSREFTASLSLDGESLSLRMGSSLRWYPKDIYLAEAEDWKNDKFAEELMSAYRCDKNCCWYFGRLVYDWSKEPILSPQEISVVLKAKPVSVTAGHFETDLSCTGKTISVFHPATGEEYMLTLQECRQTHVSFADIGAEGLVYPEYCQTLSYRISPEIERSLYDILDCADGDSPRAANLPEKECKRECGPTAVFMAGKSSRPNERAACSSLHFEPVPKVRWRINFQVTPKEDLTVRFRPDYVKKTGENERCCR